MLTPITYYKRIIRSIFSNPNGWQNDILVRDNINFLKEIASQLMEKYPIPLVTIYRGVLLDPKYQAGDKLRPIKGRYYTSFSTMKSVAEEFADPSNDLSILLALQGKTKGFIIEHTPERGEVLFHWRWGCAIGLYTKSTLALLSQYEVILLPNNKAHFLKLSK